MELTTSALTAALVGVIVILTKVIEWFMNRQNGNNKAKAAAQDFNGHGEVLTKIEAKIDVLASGMQEMRQSRSQITEHLAGLSACQERVIDRLDNVVNSIDRLADSLKK